MMKLLIQKCLAPQVSRRITQFFLNAQQLIVFRNSIRARSRTGFYLPRIRGHGEIGDEYVLSLAGTMRDDRCSSVGFGELNAVQRLSQRANLVDLDQD